MGEGDFCLFEGDYVWIGESIGVVSLCGLCKGEVWG